MTVDPFKPQGHDVPSLYRSLFTAYPDALLLVDAAGSIVLSNPEASRLLGYGPDELNGLPVDALVPDAIRPRHAAFRGAYAHNPQPRAMGTQMELVARRRDGSEVMVEIALSPLQDQGRLYVVAAVRGIGAYPRVKQALQRARYSECVAQVGRLAVDSRDPQLLLQRVPEAAAEALQADSVVIFLIDADRQSFRVAGAVHPALGDAVGAVVPNRRETPPGFVVEHGAPVVVADYSEEGRFVVPAAYLAHGLVSALAVPLSDRGQLIGVLTASTNRRRAFDAGDIQFLESLGNLLATSLQRNQSEEALNHAQRLESVGQLTGGIAHDFNNLLTIIQGNTQVLEEHPPLRDDEYARQLLASAGRATRRAAELTGKLLAFSRRQVLSPRRVDVGAMLRSLADMLQRTLEQHIRIEIDVACSEPCLADPGQLESALLNLAINARDAMPGGGTLSFTCRLLEKLPADVADELAMPADVRDAYIAIDVSDTGRGMSEAVRERAFEPFFTTKELGRGTGLGLSTVYGFVKQSRGAVRLHSTPGVGTTLALVLPRFAAADAPAAEFDAEPAVGLPSGLRVLLVEDEPEVRSVVLRFLRSLGCVVTEFATAEQALAAVGDDADYDLLLSDIALGPGMRGTELAREMRQRLPRIALLLMSGYSSDLLRGHDHPEPPVLDLLRKPFDRAQAASAIARALAMHNDAARPLAK